MQCRTSGWWPAAKRGAAVLAGLDAADERGARIHTPAGLDIGARTPAEIALSVYAEIIALLAGGGPSRTPRGRIRRAAGRGRERGSRCAACPWRSRPPPSHSTWPPAGYFCGPGCQHAFADDPSRYAHA